jgi:DNA/RNA-binding domain of Phe-tRNA-synthetase-like protein
VLRRKAGIGEGYQDIGKDFPDMENMLLLADDTGISGPSMPDSRRTMVTEQTRHVPAVIYCFETAIDLEETVRKGARPLQTLPARKISRPVLSDIRALSSDIFGKDCQQNNDC